MCVSSLLFLVGGAVPTRAVTPTPSPLPTHGELRAGNVPGAAGVTANIPIELDLAPGAGVATLQFNLSVVATGGAPALTAPVTFTSAVGPPSLSIPSGNATLLLAWLGGFAPILTGNVAIGTLHVPIPASAPPGSLYEIQVINPSATSDFVNDVILVGVPGSVTLPGAEPTNTPTPTAVATDTPVATPTGTTAVNTSTPTAPPGVQGELRAGDVPGVAGVTANVPVELDLAPGVEVATLQFNLSVVAQGGAPALTAPVTFTSAVGPPSLSIPSGDATLLLAWLGGFAPILTSNVAIGTLHVPIPASAPPGSLYEIQVINPSATSDFVNDVILIGVPGAVTLPDVEPTTTPTPANTPTPTPTPATPCTCSGDADKNGFANFADYAAVRATFGTPANPGTGFGDADCNGFVNFADYAAVRTNFGLPCVGGL